MLRCEMLRLVLVAIVTMQFAPLSSAEASEASGSSETLVGWSEDGTTYAVRRANLGDGTESLLVVQDGTVVLELCQASDKGKPSGNACTARKGMKTVSREINRINVKRHKYLEEFKFKRDLRKWRKAFGQSFMLRGTHPAKDSKDENCNQGWKLLRRGDKIAHGSEHMVDGCLYYKKGYLHPSGKYVVVQREHLTWATDDGGFWKKHETAYQFVTLKVRVMPAPEETD